MPNSEDKEYISSFSDWIVYHADELGQYRYYNPQEYLITKIKLALKGNVPCLVKLKDTYDSYIYKYLNLERNTDSIYYPVVNAINECLFIQDKSGKIIVISYDNIQDIIIGGI